jgi:hypothetical protein
MKLLSTLLVLFLCSHVLNAQTSKDVTVPLTATTTVGPTSVTLSWPNPGSAGLLVRRRTKGQGGTAWQQIINMANSNLTTLTDNNVTTGQVYEYMIQRSINNLNAYGYAHVAINAKPVDSRGKILIFVDSTIANALAGELLRLENDMRGDGWWPIPFYSGPFATVKSIKDQIVASYTADPSNVKAVLLLGAIPIPYSGNSAWDGHGDHQGAWPSDAYYADVNGNWTDSTVNNITPGRDVNKNIPDDGKFDQSYLPSTVELQIGRVDFRHINAAAFGEADQIGLMKRYLDKDHKWRIGDFPVENKALVDDNFGYFGGEAFGSNGYRNAYPLVGEANIVETDFFVGTESQSYLLGYGCGGGNYNGAGGVGSSSNFATDTVNIVFSNLFGSYFGDWDYEIDPFMPSALASRGGILTCSWAGRPHGFNQGLASGETIGFCIRETMNAQYNIGFANAFGKGGAHVALLGDPTIRAHVLKPASDLTLTNLNCKKVELNWTGSADSVDGYHVYRAPSEDGPYTRLTTTLTTGTNFIDNSPISGTLYYQVRAIKNVTTPAGGTYANNAIGLIQSINFTLPSVTGGFTFVNDNCGATAELCLSASGGTPPYTVQWSNGSTQNCTDYNLPALVSLVITDALGCAFEVPTSNVLGTPPIQITDVVVNESAPNATDGTIDITVNGGVAPYAYLWSNAQTTQDLTGLTGGTYTVTITDTNGCTKTASFIVSTTSATLEVAVFEQFLLAPNPTRGLASLTVKLHNAAAIRVEIRDWTGRLILVNPTIKTDALNLPIDLTLSPSGVYTVAVWVGNQVFARKITVVRT